ncbi:T9SS type A sorting domain-containing protein [candidate division KSB1 bacterium]|nr:T9SS type A sorting domain-containing protein [candidate division KSB1 bacterium]
MVKSGFSGRVLLWFVALIAGDVAAASEMQFRTVVVRNDKSLGGLLQIQLQVRRDDSNLSDRLLHSLTCDFLYDTAVLRPATGDNFIQWVDLDSTAYPYTFHHENGTSRIWLFANPDFVEDGFVAFQRRMRMIDDAWRALAVLSWRIEQTVTTHIEILPASLSAACFRDLSAPLRLAEKWMARATGIDSLSLAPVVTDSSECRLLLVQNDMRVGGKLRAALQMRILRGQAPRTLKNLTADIFFDSGIAVSRETPFFKLDPLLEEQYDAVLVDDPNFYHFSLSGKNIGDGERTGFLITRDWQTLVLFDWTIGSSGFTSLALDESTLEAAYYNQPANRPERGYTPWYLVSYDLGIVRLMPDATPPLMVRALVSRSEQLTGGKVDLLLQLKSEQGDSIRTLRSFECDIYGTSESSGQLTDPAVEWAFDGRSGYACRLTNQGDYFRIEIADDGVGHNSAIGWDVTGDWQTVVRITIYSVPNQQMVFVLDDRTLNASYFQNTRNLPDGGWQDWMIQNLNVESEIYAIELTNLSANRQGSSVVLQWETQSETQNFGFHVYKSLDSEGDFLRLTREPIPGALNSQSVHSYRFVDSDVKDGHVYYYKLSDIDITGSETFHGPVSVALSLPEAYRLYPVYPNPFNERTTIEFELTQPADVRLEIFDINGRRVKTILEEERDAGRHREMWDATDARGCRVATGLYLVQLIANQLGQVQKVQLLR